MRCVNHGAGLRDGAFQWRRREQAKKALSGSNRALACGGDLRTRASVGLDSIADPAAFRNSHVVVVLKVQPELCWQAKILSETNGSLSADGPVSPDHFINAGKLQRLRQRIGSQPHRLHELGLQNLSWMQRKDSSRVRHSCSRTQ